MDKLETELNETNAKNDELTKQLTDVQKDLSEAEDANIQLEEDKENLTEKLSVSDKKIEEQAENLAKALDDNKLLQTDLDKAKTEITDLTMKVDDLLKELDELKNNKVELTESDTQTITIEPVEQKTNETQTEKLSTTTADVQTEKVEEPSPVVKAPVKKVKKCKIKTCGAEIPKGSLCSGCKVTHKLVKGKDGKTRIKKR